ncbi:MAG: flippase-like domain-containing protein [Solirubrobacterales bacterium]|nr:flippase-like domain-containing protein [Solirubrobacterales bacterium]MBV9717214.1 flippase-like domain-containing protein [Solirubrobacterales bacterium]
MAATREHRDEEVTRDADRDAVRLRRGIVWTAALAGLLIGVALAVPDLREVLERVTDAGKGWLVLAVALELASCLGYVATVRLVLRRGPAKPIRHLAWAEMAFGAVVPLGGAGSLAVGAWAMRAWGVAWSRVANRSAVIFLLTSGVNAATLALAGLGVGLGLGAGPRAGLYGLVPAAIGSASIAVFWALPRWRARNGGRMRAGRLEPILQRTATWVADTEAIAFAPDWRLLGAIGYLIFDIAVLWACLRAVGASPPVLALALGYQIGYLANVVPIPGAVGALDGGLLGALVLYGLPAAPAAAAIVLYHAIALAVPAIGGTAGFVRLRRSFTDERRRAVSRAPALGTLVHRAGEALGA